MTTLEQEDSISGNPSVSPVDLLPEKFSRRSTLVITLSWETLLWVTLAVSAFVTRFWSLGARVMSHDESLHVFYSWLLSIGMLACA